MKTVLTTINSPSEATKILVEKVGSIIVIGDKKTPPYQLEGATFYSWDYPWDFKLAKLLPFDNYARKNLGYLEAMKSNNCIYETDDDNYPTQYWGPKSFDLEIRGVMGDGWINMYSFFSKKRIWPRGLPLQYIKNKYWGWLEKQRILSPIQQCLVDKEPDVDAIWRIMYGESFYFEQRESLFTVNWCPFNSQNTWWFSSAFPLMYLPSTCNSRTMDIWRSLIAQACLWEMGGKVVFHAPDVIQERNDHIPLEDFKDEIPVYLYTEDITDILEDIRLGDNTCKNLFKCYKALVKNGIFEEKELELVNTWIEDYENIRGN
jgi:hypothetical protein